MREIKFRGKCVYSADWVYGSLITNIPELAPTIVTSENSVVGYINTEYTVDPETVGEYTGLKDKDGTKIYEGDIVVLDNETAWVTFDDGCFCVLGYLGDGRTYPIRSSMFLGKEIKVIGNIHENPELLEVQHDSN